MNNDFQTAKKNFRHSLMSSSNGRAIICNLHDLFIFNKSTSHNCIGCNLAQSINWIDSFFDRIETYKDEEEIFIDYIMRLYLFVERCFELFNIISLPQQYRKVNFDGFDLIHKWANFLKHPKAFMFCHHPEFKSFNDKLKDYDLIIDSIYVKKYYSGAKKNFELYKNLTNKKNILVLFPTAEDLMKFFSSDVNKIYSLIKDNKVYLEILNKSATYEEYFASEDRMPKEFLAS